MPNLTQLGYDEFLIRSANDQLPLTAPTNNPNPDSSSGSLSGASSGSSVTMSGPLSTAQVNNLIPDNSLDYKKSKSTFTDNEDIKSSNFVSGSAGWQIKGDGTVEFSSGTFRGALSAATIDIGGADATSFHVDINGNLWSGAATFAAAPFSVSSAGAVIATSITLTGGTINYGKTSFSDSVNAGYYISSSGIYIGSASDVSVLKYTIASGVFDFIGTISSRSTVVVAAAINSSGNLITDVINARLDTDSKKVLSDFNFGTTNYAGAVKSGDITWNTTTGAVTGGSGVVVYRAGIIGAAAGVTTFSIDATTGSATFAGTLSAPTGNFGGFTISGSTFLATNLVFTSGAANTANITVGTGATAGGLNSASAGSDIVFWAGSTFANRATAPFRVDANGNLTATSATISGYLISTKGTFGGDGSDGALAISSGTTTINCGGAAVVVKNYTSIAITGTGQLAFSSPNSNGTIIILKSQGAVTLTSATDPNIEVSGMGAAGAAGTTSSNATPQPGATGSAALQNLFQVGAGTLGNNTNGTVGVGGGPATFLYSNISQVLNKYPNAFCGSGGGSGSQRSDGTPNTVTSGAGGNGGGGLIIECGGALNFTGTIYSKGNAGGTGTTCTGTSHSSGGGGGGGGYVLILYNSLTANTGTFTLTGGVGGLASNNSTSPKSNGGGGGGSATTAGSNGISERAGGVTDGGAGATGVSNVILNTVS